LERNDVPIADIPAAWYIDEGLPAGQYRYRLRAYTRQSVGSPTEALAVETAAPDLLPALEEPAEPEKPLPDEILFHPAPEPPEPEEPVGAPAPAPCAAEAQPQPEQPQPKSISPPPAASLPAVSNLRAASRGATRVELNWSSLEEAEGYRIYRSVTPWCSYGLLAETREATYLDTVPEAGGSYYYFVQAFCGGVTGAASAYAQVSAFDPPPPPDPPERLRASLRGPWTVELHWARANGAAAYAVSVRPYGEEEFRLLTCTKEPWCLHTDAAPGTRYDYRVQSYHDSGVSEPSRMVWAQTAPARQQRPAPEQSAPPAPPVYAEQQNYANPSGPADRQSYPERQLFSLPHFSLPGLRQGWGNGGRR
jgi:hypothetical protein